MSRFGYPTQTSATCAASLQQLQDPHGLAHYSNPNTGSHQHVVAAARVDQRPDPPHAFMAFSSGHLHGSVRGRRDLDLHGHQPPLPHPHSHAHSPSSHCSLPTAGTSTSTSTCTNTTSILPNSPSANSNHRHNNHNPFGSIMADGSPPTTLPITHGQVSSTLLSTSVMTTSHSRRSTAGTSASASASTTMPSSSDAGATAAANSHSQALAHSMSNTASNSTALSPSSDKYLWPPADSAAHAGRQTPPPPGQQQSNWANHFSPPQQGYQGQYTANPHDAHGYGYPPPPGAAAADPASGAAAFTPPLSATSTTSGFPDALGLQISPQPPHLDTQTQQHAQLQLGHHAGYYGAASNGVSRSARYQQEWHGRVDQHLRQYPAYYSGYDRDRDRNPYAQPPYGDDPAAKPHRRNMSGWHHATKLTDARSHANPNLDPPSAPLDRPANASPRSSQALHTSPPSRDEAVAGGPVDPAAAAAHGPIPASYHHHAHPHHGYPPSDYYSHYPTSAHYAHCTDTSNTWSGYPSRLSGRRPPPPYNGGGGYASGYGHERDRVEQRGPRAADNADAGYFGSAPQTAIDRLHYPPHPPSSGASSSSTTHPPTVPIDPPYEPDFYPHHRHVSSSWYPPPPPAHSGSRLGARPGPPLRSAPEYHPAHAYPYDTRPLTYKDTKLDAYAAEYYARHHAYHPYGYTYDAYVAPAPNSAAPAAAAASGAAAVYPSRSASAATATATAAAAAVAADPSLHTSPRPSTRSSVAATVDTDRSVPNGPGTADADAAVPANVNNVLAPPRGRRQVPGAAATVPGTPAGGWASAPRVRDEVQEPAAEKAKVKVQAAAVTSAVTPAGKKGKGRARKKKGADDEVEEGDKKNRHFFVFDSHTYECMELSLANPQDPTFVTGVTRKRWRRLMSYLDYHPSNPPRRTLTWKGCALVLAPKEDWREIVINEFHAPPGSGPAGAAATGAASARAEMIRHRSFTQTLKQLSRRYQTRRSRAGIPVALVEQMCYECPCYGSQQEADDGGLGGGSQGHAQEAREAATREHEEEETEEDEMDED